MATERYKETVRRYGFFGYLRFLYNKTCSLLSDGRYYQQSHMSRIAPESSIGRLISSSGTQNTLLTLYLSVFQHLIAMGFLFAALLSVKTGRSNESFLFAICMFGLILFFGFWEAKSRYLINYTPMLLMNFVLMMGSLAEITGRGGDKSRKITARNLLQYEIKPKAEEQQNTADFRHLSAGTIGYYLNTGNQTEQ